MKRLASRTAVVINALIVVLGALAIWQVSERMRSERNQTPALAEPEPELLAPGTPLPPVGVRVLDGATPVVTLPIRDVLRGTCRIINFFAFTCPACQAVAPDWFGVHEVNEGGFRLRVAWVSTRVNDDSVRTFVERHKLGGPAYQLQSPTDTRALGVSQVPFSIVIDTAGKVIGYRGTGVADSMADEGARRRMAASCPARQVSTATGGATTRRLGSE